MEEESFDLSRKPRQDQLNIRQSSVPHLCTYMYGSLFSALYTTLFLEKSQWAMCSSWKNRIDCIYWGAEWNFCRCWVLVLLLLWFPNNSFSCLIRFIPTDLRPTLVFSLKVSRTENTRPKQLHIYVKMQDWLFLWENEDIQIFFPARIVHHFSIRPFNSGRKITGPL